MGEKPDLSRQELIHFLKSVLLFQRVSVESLEALLDNCGFESYETGQTILEENISGSSLYVVYSGEVEVCKLGEDGEYVVLTRLGGGDYFGEMSIITGEETSARINAATPCEVIVVFREVFDELLGRHPEIYQQLVVTLSSRLRQTDMSVIVQRQKEIMLNSLLEGTKQDQYAELEGRDNAFKKAVAEAKRIFDENHMVYLKGEKGAGKEAVAYNTHKESARSEKPFITVDWSQFRDDEWGDKLFGSTPHTGYEEEIQRFGYLELVEGGTILLKNVDLLSPQLQMRLKDFIRRQGSRPSDPLDVKLILTSRMELESAVESGEFDGELHALMEECSVKLPPLRERKRDIPALARHFVEKHSVRMNKSIGELDNEVMGLLLSHDYSSANVQELEEVIERSIILTDSERIGTEHLFLGPPVAESGMGFNFIHSALLRALVKKRIWPLAFQIITAAVFAAIFYFLYAGSGRGGENRGLVLVWVLWWPALFLSFFWLGRAWCGVCPMGFASRTVQKLFSKSLPVPSALKKYDYIILTVGFLLIVWLEEVTDMRQSAPATSYLLLAILAGAVVSGVLFQRQCWCRHLCPLGGMVSLFATTSVIELRSNTAVCANSCTSHNCYTGVDSKNGCPMFQHLMFQDSNQYCKLCLICAEHCPHDVVQLNLRMPGQDLWTSDYSRNKMNVFAASLLGALMAVLVFQRSGHSPSSQHGTVAFAIYFSAAALGAVFLLQGVAALTVKGDERLMKTARKNLPFTYLPLLLGAFLAFHIQFLTGLEKTTFRADFMPILLNRAAAEWSALHLVQGTFIVFGLLFSFYVLFKVGDRIKNAGGGVGMVYWIANVALMAVYGGAVFNLLTG